MNLKGRLTQVVVIVTAFLAAPLVGISQIPPDPPAGNPDGVPFDDNMNLLFLAAGIVFAAVIVIKQLRRKSAVTTR